LRRRRLKGSKCRRSRRQEQEAAKKSAEAAAEQRREKEGNFRRQKEKQEYEEEEEEEPKQASEAKKANTVSAGRMGNASLIQVQRWLEDLGVHQAVRARFLEEEIDVQAIQMVPPPQTFPYTHCPPPLCLSEMRAPLSLSFIYSVPSV
jgi:hypothetical protein